MAQSSITHTEGITVQVHAQLTQQEAQCGVKSSLNLHLCFLCGCDKLLSVAPQRHIFFHWSTDGSNIVLNLQPYFSKYEFWRNMLFQQVAMCGT